jgi:uncharacterized protein YihD (DUF1040 family)
MLPLLALAVSAQQPSPQAPPPPPSSPAAQQPVELDHVVAIIGSNVLLQSDVEQEMHLSALEPLQVLPGQNTPDASLRRLVDRTLILEQMKQQQQATDTPEPEVRKSIEQLRTEIPACARYHCENESGWNDFLKAHALTPELVQQRWSQRMAMLHFIDLRFRSGIRISQDQIADYYHDTLVPALDREHQTTPPLANVSGRVQEILLQQQVSGLFQDWLGSLRDQGNVRIVDDAYNADLGLTSAAPGTSE